MLQNVADGTACTSDMCHVASCQSGTCTQGASLPKDDGNPCTDDTCTANVGITHTFNQTTCPPPSGAASTDPTVPTSFANATSFLQTNQGAQTGAVIASRAAVIRGRVIARDVYPNPSVIANITVSILGHPELGATLTRSDGWFDLAVNGGETYTVQFACGQYCTVSPPYVTVHRQATTRWLDYTILPDVALVQKDAYAQPQVTADSGTWQVARGSVVTDTDGKRQATLLIPPSTHACTSPSCATPFAGPYTMRLTEATVGTMGNSFGPAAMPADLPPQSGYTYAVEMSIDEADMAGLTSVAFNNTLLFYLDNFINIPLAGDAGATIPSGSYSRAPDAGAWRTEQNGLAVDIIGFAVDAENNLAAKLSVDGSTEMNYSGATPQVTDGERETLATIYQAQYQDAGTISLWRMPTQHFTPWDFNYAESFPNDAIPPPAEKPIADTPPPDPTCHAGSIVECEGQVLGESIPVPGTPFSLHYRSETQSGYHPTLTIPVTDGRGLPGICQRV